MSRLGMQDFDAPLLAICAVAYFVTPSINSASYSANATINWNTAIINRYNMWNPSIPNRIMIPVDGFYKVGATVRFGTNHGDWNDWNMMVNSDVFSEPMSIIRSANGTGGAASTCATTIVKLKAGDFITAGLSRAYTLYSDVGRMFAYEIRGHATTHGANVKQ